MDIVQKFDDLTTSIGTRFERLDKRMDDLKRFQISNNRQIHRKPQPGLSGRERFVRHALLRLCGGADPEATFRQRYIGKAATDPATTTVAGWAHELTSADTLNFLLGGSNPSLLARLLSLGLDIGDGWPVKVPYRAPGSFAGDWVAEGEPAKVESLNLASIVPTVRKVVSLSVFSRDLRNHTNPQIESVIDTIMRADINAIADSALVDDAPQSSKRPAGLLNGVVATAAGADLAADLKALATAVLAAGGTSVAFLVNPLTAIDLGFLPGGLAYPVLDSPYVPVARIVAIDPGGFVGSVSGTTVETTEAGTVHMEDTTAKPIVDAAGAVATPVTSLWQTGRVGMRASLDAGWAIVPGRVHYLDQA
jgi:hypothetical protein